MLSVLGCLFVLITSSKAALISTIVDDNICRPSTDLLTCWNGRSKMTITAINAQSYVIISLVNEQYSGKRNLQFKYVYIKFNYT